MRIKPDYKIPIPVKGFVSGVYCFYCIEKNIYYIGSSHQVKERLQDHNNALKRNEHPNKSIQQDYNNGLHFDSFILYYDNNNKMSVRELRTIEYSCIRYFYENGYNLYNFSFCTGSKRAVQLIENLC
jgi:hypothetical protein